MNKESEDNLVKNYLELNQHQLNQALLISCKSGDLDSVRVLLTSPDLPIHADIHYRDDEALHTSYRSKHIEITKYLLASPELKEHANVESKLSNIFCYPYSQNDMEFLQYLIFDFNIQKTEYMKQYLDAYKSEEVENMFKIRDLNKDLEKVLSSDKVIQKKIKI